MPSTRPLAAPPGLGVALTPQPAQPGVVTRASTAPPAPAPASPLHRHPQPQAGTLRPVDPQAVERLATLRIAERRAEILALQQANGNEHLPASKVPLAAYLLARHIDRRPIEGQDLARLRQADDTVVETRRRLDKGRGNVDVDIERSEHESSRRQRVAREIVRLQVTGGDPHQHLAIAAAALVMRAGNCMEHASAALGLHAARQAPGEAIVSVVPAGVDHNFVELRTGEGREHDVVVDPWADGPAIMAPDGEFTGAQPPLEVTRVLPGQGRAVAAAVERRVDRLAATGREAIDERLVELEHAGARYEGHVYSPLGVMSDEFLDRARQGLDRRVKPGQARKATVRDTLSAVQQALLGRHPKQDTMRPVRPEILAAGVSRTLGSDVGNAAHEAPAIVAELRRHIDR